MTRMFCTFCPQTIWATSLGFCRNRPELSADKMYRAYESKDRILKKIRTLYFPDFLDLVSQTPRPRNRVRPLFADLNESLIATQGLRQHLPSKRASVTCGLTCYRGAEPPNPKKVLLGVLGEVPARGGVPEVGLKIGPTSQAPSRAPLLGPALPQAPPGALFGVRGVRHLCSRSGGPKCTTASQPQSLAIF